MLEGWRRLGRALFCVGSVCIMAVPFKVEQLELLKESELEWEKCTDIRKGYR